MFILFILLLTSELVTSFSFTGYGPQQYSSAQADKVHKFWEDHKNMKKSPSWFDVYLVIFVPFIPYFCLLVFGILVILVTI